MTYDRRPARRGRVGVPVLVGLALATVPAGVAAARHATAPAQLLPSSFVQIGSDPIGGTVWQGLIRNPVAPAALRPTVIYLPPGASVRVRYPVLYLLQGFRGSPYEFSSGLGLAGVADRAISTHQVRPFIAVAPPAGLTTRYAGEWTGTWETYLMRDVVPWTDRHLPTLTARSARVLAGLSAGGYGAVTVGLRHPRVFGTVESWSGYFVAPHDGSLAHANATQLAAHDPSVLVVRERARLLALRTRFFLSSGTNHDRGGAAAAVAFARELSELGLPHRLVLSPGGHNGKFWRSQLPEALRYAFPGR
jgi:enterochelin esterase-like enzyme